MIPSLRRITALRFVLRRARKTQPYGASEVV
jgi:hypothetical protein